VGSLVLSGFEGREAIVAFKVSGVRDVNLGVIAERILGHDGWLVGVLHYYLPLERR